MKHGQHKENKHSAHKQHEEVKHQGHEQHEEMKHWQHEGMNMRVMGCPEGKIMATILLICLQISEKDL